MAILQDLTFCASPEASKIMTRRREVIARLEQQKRLALDSSYVQTIKVKGEAKTKTVRPQWKLNPDGQIAFVVRQIEFQPGRRAVLVPSLDKLPDVIDMLINAIRIGELDTKLMPPAKKPVSATSKRRAA